MILIRQELVQLALALDAPNGEGVVKLVEEGVGQSRVGNEAARHGFHANEAHVVLEASLHNPLVFLGGKIRKRILQRIVAIALDGFNSYRLAMVADTDKTLLR